MIGICFRCSISGKPFWCALRKTDKFRIERIDEVAPDSELANIDRDLSLSPDDVDFTGFYCPICGFDSRSSAHAFIRCGQCSRLVCGATARTVNAGSEFRCFCGNFGLLSGSIDSYAAVDG